jgi:glutathione S-transferase
MAPMRSITHFIFSPASRLARLMIGEKRLPCEAIQAEDPNRQFPVFVELDKSERVGLWAILDHLEGTYPDNSMVPEDAQTRAEALRILDWAMGPFATRITAKIVNQKASPRFTGALQHTSPDMNLVRDGRKTLHEQMLEFGNRVDEQGYLAGKLCTVADLALAANLSALDYFDEVKWDDYPSMREWYMRVKSRHCFRPLLSDRVPGQPPVIHYSELDF